MTGYCKLAIARDAARNTSKIYGRERFLWNFYYLSVLSIYKRYFINFINSFMNFAVYLFAYNSSIQFSCQLIYIWDYTYRASHQWISRFLHLLCYVVECKRKKIVKRITTVLHDQIKITVRMFVRSRVSIANSYYIYCHYFIHDQIKWF